MSINRLRTRKKPLGPKLIVDSGAFTELATHGGYRHEVDEYADQLLRLWRCGAADIAIAVAQDFMCEPHMLARTGATDGALADQLLDRFGPATMDDLVRVHQRWTIDRYDALVEALRRKSPSRRIPFAVMPVLQGYTPAQYVRHVQAYGDRLKRGMWTGVGSVCKRQGDPKQIVAVLRAILDERPDLGLHGFGVKATALKNREVRACLTSADSTAWSYYERAIHSGRQNDWRAAQEFIDRINAAAPT